MASTNMYSKLQDTSIYRNLSSQKFHSAIAALKREAKPLTTLNTKGLETQREAGETRRQERLERRQRKTGEYTEVRQWSGGKGKRESIRESILRRNWRKTGEYTERDCEGEAKENGRVYGGETLKKMWRKQESILRRLW